MNNGIPMQIASEVLKDQKLTTTPIEVQAHQTYHQLLDEYNSAVEQGFGRRPSIEKNLNELARTMDFDPPFPVEQPVTLLELGGHLTKGEAKKLGISLNRFKKQKPEESGNVEP